MIIGTHVVIASTDADADHKFFRDVLNLSAIDADGGYLIFGLPPSEASIHQTDGKVPQHELYLLCDDIVAFAESMTERKIECGPVNDQGWGLIIKMTLPSSDPCIRAKTYKAVRSKWLGSQIVRLRAEGDKQTGKSVAEARTLVRAYARPLK